jgi:hypothetical protein
MKDIEQIKHITKISTVSLHALDKKVSPIGSASGCLITYKGKKFLLSVSHAILSEGRWGMELEYDIKKMGIKYYCPIFGWMTQGKINVDVATKDFNAPIDSLIEDPRTIDIAYAEIPDDINPIDEYFDFEAGIKYFCPKNVIQTNLLDKPVIGVNYSFYGNVRTIVNNEYKAIILTPQMQLNVRYVCDYKEDYHRFGLVEVIKDCKDFKGCSGAPIIDEEGRLVSLVTNGIVTTNVILGIKLDKLKVALDAELNDFT